MKHAIIRRTYTPASVPSIPPLTISDNASIVSNTTTVQPSSPVKASTGEDGNTSPLPMLLRQPHVYPTTTTSATNTNSSVSMLDNGSHSTANATTKATNESDQGVYSYKCGKIGPCATMIDMLRYVLIFVLGVLMLNILPSVCVNDDSSHIIHHLFTIHVCKLSSFSIFLQTNLICAGDASDLHTQHNHYHYHYQYPRYECSL